MANNPIEIKIDNQEINQRLLELAHKSENLRPLMKNIAGIFAYSTEENFANEGRPKWVDLAESTKKKRQKTGHYPGQILQATGQLASSISTYYDDDSAVIGSNLDYAAIHQLGGRTGRNKIVSVSARPYLNLTDKEIKEIINILEKFII